MRLLLVGFLALAGCGALKIEMVQPPDVVRWQTEITQSTNTHSKQICELQRKVFGGCAAEAGGPLP